MASYGFILVELVIAMVLMTLLLAAVLPFAKVAVTNYRLASAQIALVQQADYALHLLTQDLRTADPATVRIGSGADKITFHSRGYNMTYERDSFSILTRDLNNGAGAQPVTDFTHSALNDLNFAYHQGDTRIIDITLTVNDHDSRQSLTLHTSVYLEN
jgi:type II secretory pathway component PulJ